MSSKNLKRKREAPDSTSDVINHESDRKRDRVTVGEEVVVDSTPNGSRAAGDILKEALRKIIELQAEINDFDETLSNEDEEDDTFYSSEYQAEALGFAMCARETLMFLQRSGYTQNDPIYQALRDRLVGRCQGIQI